MYDSIFRKYSLGELERLRLLIVLENRLGHHFIKLGPEHWRMLKRADDGQNFEIGEVIYKPSLLSLNPLKKVPHSRLQLDAPPSTSTKVRSISSGEE